MRRENSRGEENEQCADKTQQNTKFDHFKGVMAFRASWYET